MPNSRMSSDKKNSRRTSFVFKGPLSGLALMAVKRGDISAPVAHVPSSDQLLLAQPGIGGIPHVIFGVFVEVRPVHLGR
jgi:hypothetical protein